jgi:type 1 glutamine amidotransferase
MKTRELFAPLVAGACGLALITISSGLKAQQPAAGAPAGQPAAQPQPQLDACGGRSAQPEVPCPNDVTKMLAALPPKAPATPQKPRKVLVLAKAAGYAHSSRPLAAAMINEMGKKTGAWTTDITYDAAAFTAENLKQYDAVFLDSTTGLFLDDPNDTAATAARRRALLDFVRSGKGLAGIHAASDSYHGGNRGAGGQPGGDPLWPEFNKLIGGYFKHHWNWPTPITVKIDDPSNPINATFKGKSFNINDEVYTYNQDSFSRENVHVLTSVDYSMMSESDKRKENPQRTDHDYALSWIRREGQGRVFYEALGHHESIYYDNPQMLEHILAGVQYTLGDLKADDSPSVKPKATASKPAR